MILFNTVSKITQIPFFNNLCNRLVNRYTAHGILIVLVQLEALGVLPQGISHNVDGLLVNDLIVWVGVSVGIYFIFHIPKPKNRLEKLKYQIELNRLELKLEITKNALNKYRNTNTNHKKKINVLN